jgi:hypothetical protein
MLEVRPSRHKVSALSIRICASESFSRLSSRSASPSSALNNTAGLNLRYLAASKSPARSRRPVLQDEVELEYDRELDLLLDDRVDLCVSA